LQKWVLMHRDHCIGSRYTKIMKCRNSSNKRAVKIITIYAHNSFDISFIILYLCITQMKRTVTDERYLRAERQRLYLESCGFELVSETDTHVHYRPMDDADQIHVCSREYVDFHMRYSALVHPAKCQRN
jgi:hypothetical protein